MMKLLIISVTYHTPQNRVRGTFTHAALNTIISVFNSAGTEEIFSNYTQYDISCHLLFGFTRCYILLLLM